MSTIDIKRSQEIQEAAINLVRRTTKAQGLPEKVTDPSTIVKLAHLLKK